MTLRLVHILRKLGWLLPSSRVLQLANLVLLVAMPVLYVLFVKFSEPYDDIRYWIDVGMSVVVAIGTGLVVVSTVMFGKGDTIKEKLVESYRHFSQRRGLLGSLDVFLLMVCGVLIFELIAFRQVEFYADYESLLVLNDKPGQTKEWVS